MLGAPPVYEPSVATMTQHQDTSRREADAAADGRASRGVPSGQEAAGPPGGSAAGALSGDRLEPLRWCAEEQAWYRAEAEALAERKPRRAAEMLLEAAAMGEWAGRPPGERSADIERALQLAGDAAGVVCRARSLFVRLEAHRRAVQLTSHAVSLQADRADRLAMLVESAALAHHSLGDRETAHHLLEEALELESGDIVALLHAADLQREAGNVAERARLLGELAEQLEQPLERAALLHAAATIVEAELGDDAAAEVLYLRAAAADRSYLPSALALCELYERSEQWQPLCRALEQLAALQERPEQRRRLLLRAARLHVQRSGDLDAAIADIEQAIAVDQRQQEGSGSRAGASNREPSDEEQPLELLARVHEAGGRVRQQVRALQRAAAATRDPRHAALLSREAGRLLSKLGDSDGAIAAYREALEACPGYLPALRALGPLLRHRGARAELVELLLTEAEQRLPVSVRAALLIEAAWLLEQLGDPPRALEQLQRALRLAPDHRLALARTVRLARRGAAAETLSSALAAQLRLSGDPRTTVHLQLALARSLADHDPGRAIELLGSLEPIDTNRTAAFDLLELYRRTGRYSELVDKLLELAGDTFDPDEAEAYRLDAAALLEDQLGEEQRALVVYRQVVDADPRSMVAIRGIERILRARQAADQLADLLRHELDQQPRRDDAPLLLCSIAEQLELLPGGRADAIELYLEAVDSDTSCREALQALRSVASSEGRWPELIAALEQDARLGGEPTAAASSLCEAAEIAGGPLDDLQQAAALFEAALQRYPSDRARYGLLGVRLRQQRWGRAAGLLEQLLDHAAHDQQRAQLQLQLARLKRLRLGQPPNLQLYAAAARAGLERELALTLAELYRAQRVGGLVRRTQQALAPCGDDQLAGAQLLLVGWQCELGRGDGELGELLSAAAARRPGCAAARWALERQLRRAGELAQLGEYLAEAADRVRGGQSELLTAGARAFVLAGELSRAEHHAQRCVASALAHLPALRLLAAITRARGWRGRAAELMSRIAELSADEQHRASGALEAAQLWIEAEGPVPARAATTLELAMKHPSTRRQAAAAGEKLLARRGDSAQLARLLEQRLRDATGAERVELLHRHARLLRDELRQPEAAVEQLEKLLRFAPDRMSALRELADLQAQRGRWRDVARALEQLVERTADREDRHRARLSLSDILIERLDDPQRALEVLRPAVAEHPHDGKIARRVARLALGIGAWEDAGQLLEPLASDQREGLEDRVWAWLQLAEVERNGRGDASASVRCAQQAVRLAATAAGGGEQLLAQQIGSDDQLGRVLDASLASLAVDPAPTVLALTRALLGRRPELVRRALATAQQLRAKHPQSAPLALLFAELLERSDAPTDAVAAYRDAIALDAARVEAYRGLVRVADAVVAASAAALVELLGEAGPSERTYLGALGGAIEPRGRLSDGQLALAEPLRPLEALLETVAPYLDALHPQRDHRPLAAQHPAAVWAHRLAHTLAIERLTVEEGGERGATIAPGVPTHLRIAGPLVAEPTTPLFRFWVGGALARTLGGGALVQQRGRVEDLLAALFGGGRGDSPGVQRMRKAISRAVPRKVRRQLEQRGRPPGDARTVAAYRRAVNQRANQLALVLSRHPRVALQELFHIAGITTEQAISMPRLAALMRFAISDEYAALYRTVWSG